MKKSILLFFILVFCYIGAAAQAEPFGNLKKKLKDEPAGFAGFKGALSEGFNQDRIALGENFEDELWKYLDSDVDKHYWIGLFLVVPQYLHGSKPMPELTLKIWQKGIELNQGSVVEKQVGYRFSILIMASILAQKQGQFQLAQEYKKKSIAMTESGFDTSVYFPGLNNFDKCLYEHIGGDASVCKEDSSAPGKVIVAKGRGVEGSATQLPKPQMAQDPAAQKISGKVDVKVTIDEKGNVISAEAISGPAELRKVAVAAAKKAKFKPTILNGKAVKVTGIIAYNFHGDGKKE